MPEHHGDVSALLRLVNRGTLSREIIGWMPDQWEGNMSLNVKDFGARGDGATNANADDTAAIQLNLDALMAVPRGGTLYFPAGIYIIKYTLQFVGDKGHNYTIIGDGG